MLRLFSISCLDKISLFVCCLFLLTSAALAEDVQAEFNGFDLNGNLEIAPGRSLTNDGVVIIVHETLSHGKTPYILDMQQGFKSSGINSLAITLSLGLDARQGQFNCSIEQNHRHKDGAEEIGAWVTWLVNQGVNRISLLGLERGANQAALYVQEQMTLQKEEAAAEKKRKKRKKKKPAPKSQVYLGSINKLILTMPIDLSPEQAYKDYGKQYKRDLGEFLVAAQKLVEDEKEDELIEGQPFLSCPQARVTAAAFIDYYLPKDEHSMLKYIANFPFPTLALLGSIDPQFRKFETIVSEQLEKGVGQLGVARLNGLERNLRDLPAGVVVQQASGFLRR